MRLAGGGKDSVAQRRCDRREDPARPRRPAAPTSRTSHQMHVDLAGRRVDARDLILMEIVLLDTPLLERDLAEVARLTPITTAPSSCERMRSGLTCGPQSKAMSNMGSSVALVADRNFDHGGGIADEAVMSGQPSRRLGSLRPSWLRALRFGSTRRRRPVSTGYRCGLQSSSSRPQGSRLDQPSRSDQLQQIVGGGRGRPHRQLGHERLHRQTRACTLETDRNQPIRVCATASGFSMRRLGMSYAMLIRPMPCSNGASCLGQAKQGDDARRDAAVQPGHRLAPSVQPCLQGSTDTVWKLVVVNVVCGSR